MHNRTRQVALLSGAALTASLMAGAAQAQQEAQANAGNQLEQVVVTATRQTSTVNQVSLSISAVTQSSLDQQGISSFSDLLATVPGVSINAANGTGIANVAIRGIFQGSQGAATTGFYLDDTPIMKRNVGGVFAASGNGTPLPPIFDLQRVEVLRGPQGTLYGGSSEGGTIRYITPTPSLDRYHAYVKADFSTIQDGSTSYEAGLALGGPIIMDKLGFRISFYRDSRGGWIDHASPFTQQIDAKNSNSQQIEEFHGALLWQPTPQASALLSLFVSDQRTDDVTNSFNLPLNGTVVVPTECYDNTNVTNSHPVVWPRPVAVGSAACAQYTAANPNNIVYTRPGGTLGPYPILRNHKFVNFGPLAPADEKIGVPSLTLKYNFPSFSVQLVSSYVRDQATYDTPSTYIQSRVVSDATYNGITLPYGEPYVPQFQENDGVRPAGFWTRNRRGAVAEELRFTSNDTPNSRLTWVAGLFFNTEWINSYYVYIAKDLDQLSETAFGLTMQQRYGTPNLPTGYNPFFGMDFSHFGKTHFATVQQKVNDGSFAGYAEANYKITDKLKATVGVRETESRYKFHEQYFGPVQGILTPSFATGTLIKGKTTETAFTPKAGLTYHFTPNDLVYFTAAKGFRPGGTNVKAAQSICGPAFATYGLTVDAMPKNYNSDSLWSYELGSKTRLLDGRAQINADVYRIDWSNIQTSQTAGAGCGLVFTANAGSAISQGIEVEAQALLFNGLSLDAAFTYDDAHYTQDAVAIHGPIRDLVVAKKGQKFAIPPWTISLHARYNLVIGNSNPYVRIDWRHSAAYNSTDYPLGGYSPDTNRVGHEDLVNFRAGVDYGAYDVNFFVLNLFNYESNLATGGGRSACRNADCTNFLFYNPYLTASTVQPRTLGLQLIYRD